jgi:mRNA interferase MazF
MKPGDIVLIRFPQADLTVGKLRPALVLAIAPGRHGDLLLALITSQVGQATPDFDELIDPADADYPTTGLKVRSLVRLARLITVETGVINARLGAISASRLTQMRTRLALWLTQ